MNVKTLIVTGLTALLASAACAQFEDAFFRGGMDRTGCFDGPAGTTPKTLKWKFQTGGAVISSPVVSGGRIFFGSLDGYIYAVSAADGSEVWKVNAGAPVAGAAAIADGIVYIAAQNGKLFAITATTGGVQWAQTMDSTRRPSGAPTVFGNRVYMSQGGVGGHEAIVMVTAPVGGFDRTSGTQVWVSAATGAQGFEAPLIYSNTLISAYGREAVAAYALSNGATLWSQTRYNSYGSHQFTCGALAGGKLFIAGSVAGSLHALDPVTGTRLWTTFADPTQGDIKGGGLPGNEILSSPAVSSNRVFAGSNKGLFLCLDATTGSVLWSNQIGSEIQSSPAVAGGTLYFGAHDGKLHALSETNGVELWSYDTGTRIISSPWVAGDEVYVGCDDGALYCLEDSGLGIQTSGSSVAVPEGGTNGFQVRMTAAPDTPRTVTVARVSGDTSITVQSGASLIFSSANWTSWQAVVLAAAEDSDWNSSSAVIRCSSEGLSSVDVTATEQENDNDPTYILPWAETFENDGTNAGTLGNLNGQRGWTASETVVTNSLSQGGAQSAKIGTGVIKHGFSNGTDEVWITLWARPADGEEPSTFSSASAAVFYINTNGYVAGYSNSVALVSSVKCPTGTWNRFDVYCNYTSKTWRLSVNGTNTFSAMKFYSATPALFTAVRVGNDGVIPVSVDTISIALSNPVSDDEDSDGLPDTWEQQYFGGTAVVPSAAASNGLNTVMECYIAGLDPTNPLAAFLISDLRPLTASSILRWSAASGRVYTVYWSSNLLTGFQLLQSNYTGGVFTDSVHGTAGQGFYKIEVQIEP